MQSQSADFSKANIKIRAFSDLWNQARRQDLAAGGPETRRRGQQLERGATF